MFFVANGSRLEYKRYICPMWMNSMMTADSMFCYISETQTAMLLYVMILLHSIVWTNEIIFCFLEILTI